MTKARDVMVLMLGQQRDDEELARRQNELMGTKGGT
jgi:hypothetical protein